MLLAEVAVPVPLSRGFTYAVPPHLERGVVAGARVLCDFGHRQIMGVVMSVADRAPPDGVQVKPLRAIVEDAPVLPAELLAFLRELASYYLVPIGEVLRLAVPAVERRTVERLAEQGELLGDSALARTKRVSNARELVAEATTKVEEGALRGQSREVLAQLRAGGAQPIARLTERFPSAHRIARKLEELGLVTISERDKARAPLFGEAIARDTPPAPTPAQELASNAICEAFSKPRGFLLFGVTGSGKTEVYLRAIAQCLAEKRGALVMVPEIALTPQLVGRFRARFGDDVAVVHSGLADADRHAMHTRLLRGELKVAIGARSALFAPVPSLGLIVVDEEHDSSFKQEEGVRYHARDMALLRAHRAGAVCVLGSATPSLESFELARRGKLELLRLPARASQSAVLPKVSVIDLKHVGPGPTMNRLISLPLHRALEETLSRGEQAIVFLNRRGHSPTLLCTSCGAIASCHACTVGLTLHLGKRAREPGADAAELMQRGRVKCHYCGYEDRVPDRCGKCQARSLTLEGLGTEKLEATLAEAFPKARVARLDRDVADGQKSERILEKMRKKEIDLLVGTQMVTKGHDYPDVTLVGVVNADAALGLPDFRAGERAFQLLVQVAGRAGRHDKPGRVLIQTYSPEHPAIVCAKSHDVEGFLEREVSSRAEVGYPPFSRLALLRLDSVEAPAAEQAAKDIADLSRRAAKNANLDVEVLGPAPAPLARLRGRYRFRVLLRAKDRAALRRVLLLVDQSFSRVDRRVRAVIDVDPVAML